MKISVVVPSFNQADFLGHTLDSLAAQRDVTLEVRVYDGGSTDGSVDLLRAHPAGFWWHSGPDAGQADAINRGLRETTGDIVAYLNSDDVYYPGTLARVAAYFADHPECQVVYGAADHLDAEGQVMEPYPTEPWSYDRLLHTCFICQPAAFWRRRVIDECGVFDDRLHYALDYEYWLRVGRRHPFHFLPHARLAGSRLHADTKTLSQRVRAHREILRVVQRHASSAAPVEGWLQHLSFHEVSERASAAAEGEEERRAFTPLFAAAVLRNARAAGIRPSLPLLQSLQAQLASAGF